MSGVKGFFGVSWIGIASFMNNPLKECALCFHLKPNEGMTVVLLKSKALIGSPKYLILSGDILLPSVILLAKSLDIFLPMPAPKPLNEPPSAKPIAESGAYS